MIYEHMKVLSITILLLLTVPLLAISASPDIEDNEPLPSLVPLEEEDLGREGREVQEDEIDEDYLE